MFLNFVAYHSSEKCKFDSKNKSTNIKKAITLQIKREVSRNFESGMKLNEIESKIKLSYWSLQLPRDRIIKLEWKYVWMYHYCSTLGCICSWFYTSSGLPSKGAKVHEVQTTKLAGTVLKRKKRLVSQQAVANEMSIWRERLSAMTADPTADRGAQDGCHDCPNRNEMEANGRQSTVSTAPWVRNLWILQQNHHAR